MRVDIRFPIGLMFSILGLILLAYGLMTGSDRELYQKSLQVNVNLWTGLGMLVFGILMLGATFVFKRRP